MKSLKEKAYNSKNNFVIALDGPSASGKGLIGNMLSREFNLQYVQSSIAYRGLAFLCITNNIDVNNIDKIIKLSATNDMIEKIINVDLNQERIGDYASKISAIPEVRANLTRYLIEMMKTKPRIIMEGRDVGTVIAPNADLKIFITADVNKRALRRFKQLQSEGKECILSDVLELLKERDLRDSSRAHAPLVASKDAFIIDTSDLTPEEVLLKIKSYIQTVMTRRPKGEVSIQ